MKNPSSDANRGPVKGVNRWLPVISWGMTGLIVAGLLGLLTWNPTPASSAPEAPTASPSEAVQGGHTTALPEALAAPVASSLVRFAQSHTELPDRGPQEPRSYVVQAGDSVFQIAVDFKLKPETVLWANYDKLKDNAEMISPGWELIIPSTDGVYYKVKEGDTLRSIAERFKVQPEDISSYPGNHMDMTDPQITPGQFVMVPGGWRETVQWVVPMVPRGPAGVIKNVLGPGGCDVAGGAGGTGGFVWPAVNHSLSGNDFWSGHMGIDIAAGMGAAIYAADSGVVVYAGPIGGGYGNMIMIDHANGYQTLYAHLSQINVKCGQSVYQGSLIGLAGSTGNSTGPHLHFEVRYLGGFINPWTVLQ